jgi:hypothetical protein
LLAGIVARGLGVVPEYSGLIGNLRHRWQEAGGDALDYDGT